MSQVIACPSTEAKIAILVALLFPLVALPLALSARRLGVALMLVPLLLAAANAYLVLRHVLMGVALAGPRSVVALSAGVADAQTPLIAGSWSTVLCAGIAAFAARRRPAAARPRRIVLLIVIVALLLAAIEPLFAFVFARYAYEQLFALWYGVEGLAGCLFAAALVTLFASRGAAVRPLLIAAAFALMVGAEAWLVRRHFAHIALYGLRR